MTVQNSPKGAKSTVLWLVKTALLIAVCITWQAATSPLKMTLLTGSGVNAILIIATALVSFSSGICVGMISPLVAAMLGIGTPFWVLVPFIMLGNAVLVAVWRILGDKRPREVFRIIALISAAAVKFAVLYIGIVLIALPFLLPEAPDPVKSALKITFSVSQFASASIGGAFALAIIPAVKKAERSEN